MGLFKINCFLEDTVRRLAEATKQVEGDTWELDGKKGVWREVAGQHVFFPSDGSAPVGLPKAVQSDDAKKLAENPGKAKKRFGGARGKLRKAAKGSGGEAVDALEKDGTEEDKDTLEKMDGEEDVSKGATKALAINAMKKLAVVGLGAAILGMFPAILGYAAIYMISQMAVNKVVGALFEEKFSKEDFSRELEAAIEASIDDLADGKVDEKLFDRAIRIGERESEKKANK